MMGRTSQGKIDRKLKGEMQKKRASKGSNINTNFIEYVPKTRLKNKEGNPNMLIMLSTVLRLYLYQSQTQYQIHTRV